MSSHSCGTSPIRRGELGQGRLKFLIVMAILIAGGYSLYLYIPVAYQAYLFKDLMQHDVDVAAASGYPATWVKDQLTRSAPEYSLPPNLVIAPQEEGGRLSVTVKYSSRIEFPFYPYDYQFNHTARSTQFLTAK